MKMNQRFWAVLGASWLALGGSIPVASAQFRPQVGSGNNIQQLPSVMGGYLGSYPYPGNQYQTNPFIYNNQFGQYQTPGLGYLGVNPNLGLANNNPLLTNPFNNNLPNNNLFNNPFINNPLAGNNPFLNPLNPALGINPFLSFPNQQPINPFFPQVNGNPFAGVVGMQGGAMGLFNPGAIPNNGIGFPGIFFRPF